ncbi:MAG: DUF192 domain-containing protein [Pseudomonadota bacterium]
MSKTLKLLIATIVLIFAVFAAFTLMPKTDATAENTQPEVQTEALKQVLEIPTPAQTAPVIFPKDTLVIEKQNGESISFNVELALNPRHQAQGLMFRTEMAEDAGMLFVFPSLSQLRFWMKNTLIPLDMMFLDEDGTINHIHANATPKDLTPVGPDGFSKAVLEINGGVAEKFGISVGDKVIHESFGEKP